MKKFQDLIMNCINEDITGTREEKLMQVKAIFESEMCGNGMTPSCQRVQDWLQGLCSTISIPFSDYDIIEWYKVQLKREPNSDNDAMGWCEKYWPQMGRTLYRMLYK